jgi:hypothetical protein
MKSRRQFFQTAGSVPLVTILATEGCGFSADESRLIGVLADLIIPRTDTPGASDAGVPAFIEDRLARRPEFLSTFREGMRSLNPPRFLKLSPEEQHAELKKRSDAGDSFFKLLKDLTIDSYYTSKTGLTEELEWNGNTMLPEFPGCTHPEHKGDS